MAKSNRRGRGEGLGSVPSRTLGPLPGQAVLCSADLGAGGQGPGWASLGAVGWAGTAGTPGDGEGLSRAEGGGSPGEPAVGDLRRSTWPQRDHQLQAGPWCCLSL